MYSRKARADATGSHQGHTNPLFTMHPTSYGELNANLQLTLSEYIIQQPVVGAVG